MHGGGRDCSTTRGMRPESRASRPDRLSGGKAETNLRQCSKHLPDADQKPLDFRLTAQKDPAQAERKNARRMVFSMASASVETESRRTLPSVRFPNAPGAPRCICNQVRRGVISRIAMRRGATRATLIKDDDAPERRVKTAGAWPRNPARHAETPRARRAGCRIAQSKANGAHRHSSAGFKASMDGEQTDFHGFIWQRHAF